MSTSLVRIKAGNSVSVREVVSNINKIKPQTSHILSSDPTTKSIFPTLEFFWESRLRKCVKCGEHETPSWPVWKRARIVLCLCLWGESFSSCGFKHPPLLCFEREVAASAAALARPGPLEPFTESCMRADGNPTLGSLLFWRVITCCL